MIIRRPGQVAPGLHMLGDPGVPVFLLDGDAPVVFDAGFSCMGPLYAGEIEKLLDGRHPARLLLTHSHFDHCGCAGYLKERFPGMEVGASPNAVKVFSRPSAMATIRALNHDAAKMVAKAAGVRVPDLPCRDVTVDFTLEGGQEIPAGPGATVRVLETPGHTRDCVSFFIPEKNALVCSEAAGIPDATGYIICDFLVDYDVFLDSLKSLAALCPEVVCLGHGCVLTGKDARGYLPEAVRQCEESRGMFERLLEEEGGEVSAVMARVRAFEYDPKPLPKQPEPAYLLNLEARINTIKRRMQKA
ncbi:MAG: MBL fold metallo-hydrolase [Deltaproteobacteria bacterium]|nr:MBL fold metallo-hydrolase [Deltaproteobacteria bacterium]